MNVSVLDDLGRLVIPKDIRNELNWNEYDKIEVVMEKGQIVLKKVTVKLEIKKAS